MKENEWYRELFSSEAPARLGKYDWSIESQKEVEFIINVLDLSIGNRVLDLCCGKGRHLHEFRKAGLNAFGADLSGYMLNESKVKMYEVTNDTIVCQCDMRTIPFDMCFDAVVILLTSFGYLETDEDNMQVLKAIADSLKPKGKILIDLQSECWTIRNFKSYVSTENMRNEKVEKFKEYDPITSRLNGREKTELKNGQIDERIHSVRLYTFPEVKFMLSACGFIIDDIFGDLRGSKFTLSTSHMVIVATKK